MKNVVVVEVVVLVVVVVVKEVKTRAATIRSVWCDLSHSSQTKTV